MASTEELIEQAEQRLRAEFTEQVEVLKNVLGVMLIEEVSKVNTVPTDIVSAPILAESLDGLRRELVQSIAQISPMPAIPENSKPVDAETRKLVTQIHAYVDRLADLLALPRMEAN